MKKYKVVLIEEKTVDLLQKCLDENTEDGWILKQALTSFSDLVCIFERDVSKNPRS